MPGYIAVRNANANQSVLNWTAAVRYLSGADWLVLSPAVGLNNGTIRVDAIPQKLAPGTYTAQIVIDAGEAGSRIVPVTLVVNALPPQQPTTPTTPTGPTTPTTPTTPPVTPPVNTPGVTSVTNGANFLPGPVVPGSIATVKGTKFSGKTVAVTFDAIPARVIYTDATQINLQVPDRLAGKSSAQMIVSVDGVNSSSMAIPLTGVSPAIFNNGILNENGWE